MRLKITDIEESNFYKMPKSIYELELKALDREVYMMCLENWRLSVANKWINENGEIYFYATQEKLSILLRVDRTTIIRCFKQLVEIGLLEIEKDRGNANKYFLIKIDGVVNNNLLQNATSSKMQHDLLQNATATCGKMQHNKELINKNELTKINVSIYQSQEFKQAFSDFLNMRKQIKKPATARAVERIIKKLEKVDNEAIALEMLGNSIIHSWQDVYKIQEKYDKRKVNGSAFGKPIEEIDQEQKELQLIHEKYLQRMQIENGGA